MCVGRDPLDRGPGGAAGGGVVEAEVLATGGADVMAEGKDVGLPGVPDAVTATLPDFSILEWKGYDSPLKTQVVVKRPVSGEASKRAGASLQDHEGGRDNRDRKT